MADHLDALETPDVATRRLAEDVIRAADAAAVTFFVSVEEGRARQRYRGLETDGGATRRSQRELIVSGAADHRVSKGAP